MQNPSPPRTRFSEILRTNDGQIRRGLYFVSTYDDGSNDMNFRGGIGLRLK